MPSYVQSVAPTTYPVTLVEAKRQCRIDHEDEDALINSLIAAATAYAQEYQWSQLITSTWQMRVNDLSGDELFLHPNPVQSISSITYVDQAGVTQTLAADQYAVDIKRVPARIIPAYQVNWPQARGFLNDVLITYIAGYGAATAVPQQIKQAMLLLIDSWHKNRDGMGSDKPMAFSTKALLDLNSYRVFY